MKLNISLSLIISLGIIILFTSCSSDKREEIVGKWKDRNGIVIEFSQDGNVKGLARNIKRELVEGSFEIRNDSLFVNFLAAPAPRNVKGILEFRIQKLDGDSLVLSTQIGDLAYSKLGK